MLSLKDMQRYARHLPLIGHEGQIRLQQARVVVIGAGGLGSPLLLYLAAAGVGHLGIVDHDVVDLSNLQRQILFNEQDIGYNKAERAQAKLAALNSDIEISVYPVQLTRDNAREILPAYTIIVDGTDNYPTRYLLNDLSYSLNIPLVTASILKFQAQLAIFNVDGGPCYRCLYPEPPPSELTPNCSEAGVFGVLPGVVGSLQASEVIKLILQVGESLAGKLLTYDALSSTTSLYEITKNPDCPVCVQGQTSENLFACKSTNFCGEITPMINVNELKSLLMNNENVFLLDVRQPYEYQTAHIENSLLIPLGELEQRLHEVPRDQPIVIYCKAGPRGDHALQLLEQHGYTQVRNLKGGILAWLADEESV